MRRLLIFTFLIWFAPNLVHSQEIEYPHPLKPEESFKASAEVDTLFWVLKSTQYDKASRGMKELKLLRLNEIDLKSALAKQDSTIRDYEEERLRLNKEWDIKHKEMEKKDIKILKLKRWTLISGGIGLVAGLVAGVVIF